ncbi:pyridoxamine 5'-phosphate oxidase family protein [Frigoriglobus tundricola]|uniref:General stress protein n=1 Tax=Frigoriglobus tundricola TaxID=2774151 RepID=A0A6M5YZ53_9BACT|nr:pyridoxamine 5'-phosphate oxidase family protein [Frigoriglobus tundricola]QJW98730.1 General stress protein [Frigoriglobus tundricola]
MTTAPEIKLHDLLAEFGTAMLVTRTGEGQLRARPMALAELEPDGTLWFLTDRHSAKVDELGRDPHVGVTMQSQTRFVSVSGRAAPVEDRERVSRLWKLEWKVWFPGGPDDPNLVLLRVSVDAGEYWDNGGTGGLKYLFEAGKALLTGSRPNVEGDAKIHGKVSR